MSKKKKIDKQKLVTRIVAGALAGLMVFGAGISVLVSLFMK